MTTNLHWAISRLVLLANEYQNIKISSADCCLLLAHIQSQTAQLSALSLSNYNKDAVIDEYQRQSRLDGLEIERLKRELAEAVESTKEACAAEFDRRDGGTGIGFYDPHEPAEIIRGLSLSTVHALPTNPCKIRYILTKKDWWVDKLRLLATGTGVTTGDQRRAVMIALLVLEGKTYNEETGEWESAVR